MDHDFAVIGGGVVGMSVAWGLAGRGHRVVVIDGDDGSFRASRGNFGLVWVQGKGLRQPAYARWSQRSATLWPGFAEELGAETGTDIALRQPGGYDFHMTEASLAARAAQLSALRDALGGDYPFEVLGANALRREEPEVGPRVAGAILHHQDGHVNPLRLLRALAVGLRLRGVTVMQGSEVADVAAGPGGGFLLTLASGAIRAAGRVVLAAGLGSARLGPRLGFRAPLRPQRGQVLVTARLPRLLNRPASTIRQVDEGGVQIGDSQEEVGFDDRTALPVTAGIAARAVAILPRLERAALVRSWSALRVMSPDGLPIYQHAPGLPGASLISCHSGITLAACHARLLPDWLEARAQAPDLEVFGEARFA